MEGLTWTVLMTVSATFMLTASPVLAQCLADSNICNETNGCLHLIKNVVREVSTQKAKAREERELGHLYIRSVKTSPY